MTKKRSAALVLVELLGELCGWICICASIAAVYSLYQAVANDGQWLYVLWSAVVAIGAQVITHISSKNKRRLDYVHQLLARGYPRAEAEMAWRSAANHGINVLLRLQQAEACNQGNLSRLTSGSSDTD